MDSDFYNLRQEEQWISTSERHPSFEDCPVWVWCEGTKLTPKGVYLFDWEAAKRITADPYSNWKRSHLLLPSPPKKEPVYKITEEVLAAWRQKNPDYAPDDVPPDKFVEGFYNTKKLADKAREEAFKSIIDAKF